MTTEPTSFDLGGPLPTGLLALEASAGTGKTHALSALAMRAVAEGRATASQLCIVTFTEAATAELRGRVRRGLVDAASHVRLVRLGVIDAAHGHRDRSWWSLVHGHDHDELRRREDRLRAAIAEFDAATISTIHGFCHRVLAAGTSASELALVTNGDRDIAEAVNDVVLEHHDDPIQIESDRLVATVRAMLTMPDADLYVGDPATGTAEHRALADAAATRARAAHRTVLERRRRSSQRTFDAMIADTRALLLGPQGAEVVSGLRERYRFVLIDEFQDTDRVQWDIFRTAFVDPTDRAERPTVILVGDPKQSIYRFRSAELSAYLDAVGAAGEQVATLSTNWRSDGPLLSGLDRVFRGFEFGDPSVRFRSVQPADDHLETRLDGVGGTPLEVRWLLPGSGGNLDAPSARRTVRNDVVQVVVDLLDGSATLPDPDAGDQGRRPLRPRDVAVLTRSNVDALAVAAALGSAGVPAATSSTASVLDSEAADQWSVLLRALERPGDPGVVRAAALGWFLGRSPSQVVSLDDDQLADLHDEIRSWSDDLRRGGVQALVARANAAGLRARVLAGPRGERDLTDLDHVAELLQVLTDGRVDGPSALIDALRRAADEGEDDVAASDRLARRIDRDDDAVQVLTMHKAKGLQFPVVLCPFLWTSTTGSGIPHAQVDGRHLIDAMWTARVPSKAKAVEFVKRAARQEEAGETRRLMYVAMTRAQHRCVVWWAPVTTTTSTTALGDLLAHAVDPLELGLDAVESLAAASNGTVGVRRVSPIERRPAARTVDDDESRDRADSMSVAVATRPIDTAWRIWSFTSMSSSARARRDAEGPQAEIRAADRFETVRGAGQDEIATDEIATDEIATDEIGTDEIIIDGVDDPTPLAGAPAGTEFGTVVHSILEDCDFTAADLHDHLVALGTRALAHRPLGIEPLRLARGLVAAIEAPLGGPLAGVRLRDVARPDRLDELEFHLPLGRARVDEIGRVLAPLLPPEDPLRPWARSLGAHGYDIDLDGLLTGSIDLVLRTDRDGSDRYWVSDYKTNRLDGYDTDHLVDAMVHHDYPLQALLYLVALHRYLRWRRPDYRAEDHLGGAAYLFLRGMDPRRPAAEARGVFWWQPPAAAVDAVDRLLAGGAS